MEKEFAARRLLKHPNLVELKGMSPDYSCLVYEYMDWSLEQWLRHDIVEQRAQLDLERRVSILLDVAQGLAYLHSQYCNHRDMTPSNILLTRSWKAKIADVGMAQHLTPAAAEEGTQGLPGEGCAVGKEHFIDPQFRSSGRVSPYSDIYALGITILTTLTGPAVVRGQDVKATVRRCLQMRNLFAFVDPALLHHGQPRGFSSVRDIATIGLACSADEKEQRPKLHVVIAQLQEILAYIQARKRGEQATRQIVPGLYMELTAPPQESQAAYRGGQLGSSHPEKGTTNLDQ